jgi:hypothetical protein
MVLGAEGASTQNSLSERYIYLIAWFYPYFI